jgi:alkylation response protein AidB-like acyl-CoA dehydrogenase
VDFSLNSDHEMVRDMAREFLAAAVDHAALLKPGASVADSGAEALWSKMVELGWPGLIIPEAQGGAGMSALEAALIATEIGRALGSAPLLGSYGATWALLKAGSSAQQQRLLPQIATGAVRVAFADGQAGVVAAPDGTLSGEIPIVADASGADHLVVVTKQGEFFLIDASLARIERLPWRDITRDVCRVRLLDVAAERLPHGDLVAWHWVRDRLWMMLAAESAGGLHATLDATVAYAKERVAFGKPIGAFQAIKHQLAEMKGDAEAVAVAVLYAGWALSVEDDRAPLAAAMAQAAASEAYRDATFRSIQIFGAIGFTWEMRNHLYFKRARANAEMLGGPAVQREAVIAFLEGAA